MTKQATIAAIAAGSLLAAIALPSIGAKRKGQISTAQGLPATTSAAPSTAPPTSSQVGLPSVPRRHPGLAIAESNAQARSINEQDSYLDTKRAQSRFSLEKRSSPGYQHLPYRNSEVSIEITNVTGYGRVLLTVIPRGLNVNPRIAYQRFLKQYRDSGSAYTPVYDRYQP